MLSTLVMDVFASDGREAVRQAADTLVNDYPGWDSAGLYCFWDPDTRAILYVGLDRHLPHRFAQHTGLRHAPVDGCKVFEVNNWFMEHEALGITFVLQSELAPQGNGQAGDDDAVGTMKWGEGQLIASVRRRTGRLPPWNKIGGAAAGAAHVARVPAGVPGTDQIVSGTLESLFMARRRLRELVGDVNHAMYEVALHGARMNAVVATLGRPGDDEIMRSILRLDREGVYPPGHLREWFVVDRYLENQPIHLLVQPQRPGHVWTEVLDNELTSTEGG